MRYLLPSSVVCFIFLFNSVLSDVLFDCDFETDNCGFVDDIAVEVQWKRYQGPTPSRETGPDTDYTNGTKLGYYSYAEASNTGIGEKARITSPLLKNSGGKCTRLAFYYYTYGEDPGYLYLYLLGDKPYYFENPVWEDDRSSKREWRSVQLDLSISVNYSIAFETVFGGGGLVDKKGDVAIDGISVDSIDCEYDSCENHVTCLNGGTCVAKMGTSNFEYICECVDGWSGDHCENDFDECSSTPCNNGATCIHGLNEIHCECDLGFYGATCEFIDMCIDNQVKRCLNGGTCNNVGDNFNCTCRPGFSGATCEINIDDCALSPCQNGGTCNDLVDSYTCDCLYEYKGFHCQSLVGGCDFDDNSLSICGYKFDYYQDLDWKLNQGRTPIGSTGPPADHTTGQGYYVYAEIEFQANKIARLLSPELPQSSVAACTNVTFWYYMDGTDIGTLNIYISTGYNSIQTMPSWTLSGGQGNEWRQGYFEVSSPVPYSLVFDAVTTLATLPDYIAIDDVSVHPGACVYRQCSIQPCKNGGTCIEDGVSSYICECPRPWTGVNCTEDRNECNETPSPCINSVACTDHNPGYECTCSPEYVGYNCEYIRGSCNFEDPFSRKCSYTDDDTGDFVWKSWQGPTPTDLTGPSVDHTLGTEEGYYLYTETSPQEGGDKARIVSPVVPNSGSQCTGLDFWYHMFGNDVGELAMYVEYGNEPLTIPIWNIIGNRTNSVREWVRVELNISAPSDFRLVFEVTVLPQGNLEPENRGDIAIDDIEVHFDRNCNYDKCFEKPCMNGAICTAIGGDDYHCECTPGYDGKNCDNTPVCVPNPCYNGGTCVLGSNGNQECLCKHGWIGTYCDTKDYCYPNPCEHGGTCTTFTTTYVCQCRPGYLGDNCETDIDECQSSPCMNGAQCLDLSNAYQCECVGQYFGERCNKIEGGCNFEDDFCGWASESLSYKWIRQDGNSPNWPLSGPRTDHTFSNGSGFYIFTEVYSDQPVEGTQYRFESPTFLKSVVEPGKILTFQFYYHMVGTGMGNLNVYFKDGGATQLIDQITQDETAADWRLYSRKFEPVFDFGFIIEHQTVKSVLYLADMAVDDIDILIEDSGNTPDTTTVVTTIQTTTKPTTTIKVTDPPTTTKMPTTTKTVDLTPTIKPTTIMDTSTLVITTLCDDDDECDDDDDNEDDGLDGGAIAGIVIGVLLATVGLVFLAFIVYTRMTAAHQTLADGGSGVPLSKSGIPNAGYVGESDL
uniref:MAM and LDL-receptor class A domain-containing protein 2-like n=1 Tax=Styela clava TaxID=7725 RepID=UPI00193ABC70|nr:MAM and LDL-receptor class A domain-containing protein 2-like [Styela clava]